MLSISDSVLAGPLITGGAFTYDLVFNGSVVDSYTDTVAGPTTVNGHPVVEIDTNRSQNGNTDDSQRFEALDPTLGFLVYQTISTDISGGDTTTTTDTELPYENIAPPTLVAGTTYSSSWTDSESSVSNPGGFTGSSSTSVSFSIELVSDTEHSITVPAGTLKTYQLNVTEAQTDQQGHTSHTNEQVWVAPNIGIVEDKVGSVKEELASFTGGPATKLVFMQEPAASAIAGNVLPAVKVEAENAVGSVVSDGSSVTLSIGSGPKSAKIGGTLTEPLVGGVATFSNLSITDARTFKFAANDGTASPLESTSFTITPAAPAELVFHQQPVNTVAGVASISASVEVKDKFGNVATNDSTTVVTLSLGSGPSSAHLLGTLSKTASDGIVTFSGLSLTRAANFKLEATSTGLPAAKSKSFTVLPTVPAELVFHQQPANTVAGVAGISTTVEVKDQYGNVVTNDSSTVVTLSIGSGPSSAKLLGTLTATASDGIATFSGLSLTDAVNYKLEAMSTGLPSVKSKTFSILPTAPASLVFLSTQPTTDTVNGILTPPLVVRIKDKYGNVVNTNTSQVTLTLSSKPTGGTMTGVLIENAIAGVATFSDVKLGVAGKYVIEATDGILPVGKSKTITVANPGG